MVTNPYKDEYRRLVDSPPSSRTEREVAYGHMMIDLYHALDEALGRIYELEQTLEGREYPAEREDELVPVGDREWNE